MDAGDAPLAQALDSFDQLTLRRDRQRRRLTEQESAVRCLEELLTDKQRQAEQLAHEAAARAAQLETFERRAPALQETARGARRSLQMLVQMRDLLGRELEAERRRTEQMLAALAAQLEETAARWERYEAVYLARPGYRRQREAEALAAEERQLADTSRRLQAPLSDHQFCVRLAELCTQARLLEGVLADSAARPGDGDGHSSACSQGFSPPRASVTPSPVSDMETGAGPETAEQEPPPPAAADPAQRHTVEAAEAAGAPAQNAGSAAAPVRAAETAEAAGAAAGTAEVAPGTPQKRSSPPLKIQMPTKIPALLNDSIYQSPLQLDEVQHQPSAVNGRAGPAQQSSAARQAAIRSGAVPPTEAGPTQRPQQPRPQRSASFLIQLPSLYRPSRPPVRDTAAETPPPRQTAPQGAPPPAQAQHQLATPAQAPPQYQPPAVQAPSRYELPHTEPPAQYEPPAVQTLSQDEPPAVQTLSQYELPPPQPPAQYGPPAVRPQPQYGPALSQTRLTSRSPQQVTSSPGQTLLPAQPPQESEPSPAQGMSHCQPAHTDTPPQHEPPPHCESAPREAQTPLNETPPAHTPSQGETGQTPSKYGTPTAQTPSQYGTPPQSSAPSERRRQQPVGSEAEMADGRETGASTAQSAGRSYWLPVPPQTPAMEERRRFVQRLRESPEQGRRAPPPARGAPLESGLRHRFLRPAAPPPRPAPGPPQSIFDTPRRPACPERQPPAAAHATPSVAAVFSSPEPVTPARPAAGDAARSVAAVFSSPEADAGPPDAGFSLFGGKQSSPQQAPPSSMALFGAGDVGGEGDQAAEEFSFSFLGGGASDRDTSGGGGGGGGVFSFF